MHYTYCTACKMLSLALVAKSLYSAIDTNNKNSIPHRCTLISFLLVYLSKAHLIFVCPRDVGYARAKYQSYRMFTASPDPMFKFLFSWSPAQQSPSWKQGNAQDPIDLQVKSLTYAFKRLNIPQLGQFARDNQSDAENHAPTAPNALPSTDTAVADKFYAITKFQYLLYSNEHRVLTDWAKNYFRATCILSDYPSTLESLPKLGPNFRFIVLQPDTSRERYIDILAHSDIYMEHLSHVTVQDRQAIVENLIDQRKESTNRYDLDTRFAVILAYLETVARAVQIERLYRASVRLSAPQVVTPAPKSPPKQVLSTLKKRPSIAGMNEAQSRPRTAPLNQTSPSKFSSTPPTSPSKPARPVTAPTSPSKAARPVAAPTSPTKMPTYNKATSSSTLRAKKSTPTLKVTAQPAPVLPVTLLDGTPVVPPYIARQLRKQAENAVAKRISAERQLLY